MRKSNDVELRSLRFRLIIPISINCRFSLIIKAACYDIEITSSSMGTITYTVISATAGRQHVLADPTQLL